MKIGYPCINHEVGCTANRTFRLRSYSESLLQEIIESNLKCLQAILEYNLKHDILFFRIGSGLVPFASHHVCEFNWERQYRSEFAKIGEFVTRNRMRVSMHPDQFTLINSLSIDIFRRSVSELAYHAGVLELMNLGDSAKMQIHIGGVYNNKPESIRRFIKRYKQLPEKIKRHLVIENDDRLYTLKDCMQVHDETGVPVLFDVFHHSINNNSESIAACMPIFAETWKKKDGIPMVDYSLQQKLSRKGAHAMSISVLNFKKFLKITKDYDFDIMLEIKDKQKSALKAVEIAKQDTRFA
jgi:UV DNA damage endonuclease